MGDKVYRISPILQIAFVQWVWAKNKRNKICLQEKSVTEPAVGIKPWVSEFSYEASG